MKTKGLQLKMVARMMLFVLFLSATGITKVTQAQPLSDWEQQQNYLFYLVYDDVQALQTQMPVGSKSIREEQLPPNEGAIGNWTYSRPNNTGWLGLAKNEREGFQVFFREQEKIRNLRIEVSPFHNAQNEVLEHLVYYEEFFYAEPYGNFNPPQDSLAEALVPYFGEVKTTQVGYNLMFYVELSSRKDQTPGAYVSTVTIYDGDEVLTTRAVTAKVWNFVLPEGHYAEVVMGLYNRNSSYRSTSTFLTLNGIDVDANGNVALEDMEEAKRILDGYQSCLLEHGVSTYEIPRWLMEDDPKAAELTMADPRRKVFTVPVLYGDLRNSGSDFSTWAKQVLQQYKDIVYDNPFLKDKAFFYPKDEPNDSSDFAAIDQFCSVLSGYWPGYHATVPFYSEYYSTVEAFEGKIDILCPTKGFFDPGQTFSNATIAEQRLQDYMTRPHTWWKPDNAKTGGVDYFVYNTASVGVIRRILFWQQYLAHGQGLLYWNCAFLPDNWQKKSIPLPGGIRNGNGDGILLYPGTMFGQDAATPVVSLRLKQLSAGIDDYDYMRLVEEFLGEEKVWEYLGRAFHFGRYNFPDVLCGAMNKELEVFRSYTCHPTQINRWWYGRLLDEAANIEHDWGEWQTAVLPDETHAGLEIRTCSHCGAQESREKTFLYRFVGTEDDQWTNLANWEGNPETLPSSGEAVVIAHDCEINTNTTVFNVIVSDGFNLTINEGATLNSRRVATGENARVIIEDGAQLYTHSEGIQATVKKNIAPHGDADGWYFISTSLASDVTPSTSNGIISSSEDSYDLYYFDQCKNEEWRNYKANGFDLESGKGYLYANLSEMTLNFEGLVNASNAEISIPISYTSSPLAGLNLVGNPYTCEAYLLDENNEIMPFYKLNATGDSIVAAQAGTAIMPCEGVFVICPNDRETHSAIITTTAPANIGETQDVPPVLLPIHDLLVNQDASLTNDIIQTTTLTEGWNWWSTHVDVTLDELKAALVETLPGTNITIKSKTQNMHYNDTTWRGNLNSLDVTQMYKISVNTSCEIMLEGIPVDPADHPVTITNGINWIEFPLRESMTLTEAFDGFAISGDLVKSKDNGIAIYNGTTWVGSLNTLVPGEGYIYKSNATESRILTFPSSTR